MANPITILKRELKQVQSTASGMGPTDDKSVPAKLTYFLEAVNGCPQKVDIAVQSINVTEKTMKVKGDTNSRSSTMTLFSEIKSHKRIKLASQRIRASSGRDTFEITIELQ